MDVSVQTAARQAAGPSSGTLSVAKLTPMIGAEILGLDLRSPIDREARTVLRQAWHDHAVLVVRDQVIGRKEQARFGEVFGDLQMVRDKNGVEHPYPWVIFVTNIRKDGKPIGYVPDGELQFHSDLSYFEEPPVGTVLYSIEVPSKGGNTLFANMYAAYDALPADMKARLTTLSARHSHDLADIPLRRQPHGWPTVVHPVIRTHPVTGRKVLFVNRLFTIAIEGLSATESDALLETLFEHQEQPRFCYEHVWRPGDVILWDNRCTLHARTDFSPAERRLLRRLVVLREHPAPAAE